MKTAHNNVKTTSQVDHYMVGLFTMQKVSTIFFAFLLALGIASCSKDRSGTSQVSVQMTDAPANYDAVSVNVTGMEITGENGSAVTLNTNAAVYNLLDLSNGVTALIATGDLNAGAVSHIRLILGDNNTVTVDGIVKPLSTLSALQSGLKLQIHQTFEAGVSYSILLDFDANQSVVKQGDGTYQLKPVIRTIDTAVSGSIKGSITPVGLIVAVSAVSGGITYSSVTNAAVLIVNG